MNYVNSNVWLFTLAFALVAISCRGPVEASDEALQKFESIIPKPSRSDTTGFAFEFHDKVSVAVAPGSSDEVKKVALHLLNFLGSDQPIIEGEYEKGTIHLRLVNDEALKKEGYRLTINNDGIQMEANEPGGLFYSAQTLKQLLIAQSDGTKQVAAGTVEDVPRFAWRGVMLDVGRHFFDVDEIKRFIDLIALYKMNTLHLSLSNDQGWRIEIKSWPKLTEIGGTTEVGGGPGGFYTQDQYTEIVRYAADRFVTMVPEIDMPGHINAALASYPELNCDGKSPQRYTGIEVGFSSLCASKEITYRFVNDVIREISTMTPGPYVHVGGDEAAATAKPDYIQFINRFREIVNRNGKQMVAWEEAAQGQVDSTCVLQHWHSTTYARAAAEKGAQLILSPASRVYLDMKYDSTTKLGLKWAGYIGLQTAYDWDPATWVEGLSENQIKGVEAPVWTETLETLDQLEFMLFPRLVAVAEVAWTEKEQRSWENFRLRISQHGPYFKMHQIDFYPSPQVPWR